MFKKNKNFYSIEDFSSYNIAAIYTNKSAGDMASPTSKNRSIFIKSLGYNKKIISAKQTHSNNIAVIEEDVKENYNDIDGFITSRKDIILFTQYADCLPIYFIDPVKSVIGICHSGWKGSYEEIGIKMVELFKSEYNSNMTDIKIAIGIGIKSCCYEVGHEFYKNFKSKFDEELIKSSFVKKENKWYFDNELFNYELLKKHGIKTIIKSNICTYCQDDFFSYRKEKTKGRNGAFIFFK